MKKASLLSLLTMAVLLSFSETVVFGQAIQPTQKTLSDRNSEIELRLGYLVGANRIFLRDGNDVSITPEKREIGIQSPLLQLQGQTRRSSDWLLRLQTWTNLPQTYRHDWVGFDRETGRYRPKGWDTKALTVGADISGGYLLGLGGFPYSAAPVVGYRYTTFRYDSTSVSDSQANFDDRIQVHIPYIGVYYDNSDFVNSVVKLDLRTSLLTLAQIDSSGSHEARPRWTGNSVLGFWFEAMFSWNVKISERGRIGFFADYYYLEFTAGITASQGNERRNFSLDSRLNTGVAGTSFSYLF